MSSGYLSIFWGSIQAGNNTQVWSLKHFRDAHVDSGPHSILDIDLSSDASLLAIGAATKIEVWDVRIDRCRYVIESESASSNCRPIDFSPSGELIVSDSRDGIIVIDVQTGIIRPTIYSVKGRRKTDHYNHLGISFDDSRLAASLWEFHYIQIWDLPSGVPLYTIVDWSIDSGFRWSWRDLYLMFGSKRRTFYLNAKTFREEVLSDPGDRFHDRLHRKGNMLCIRSPRWWKDHLFVALPSHLKIKMFRCRGDRVIILTQQEQLLFLDVSGLDAFMKEFCAMESEPEGRFVEVSNNRPIL